MRNEPEAQDSVRLGEWGTTDAEIQRTNISERESQTTGFYSLLAHKSVTISEIHTKKRCTDCGGKFMLERVPRENGDVLETFYCENFCFTKEKLIPATNVWADYIHKNGKSYMANQLNPNIYREVYISEDKKGAIRIRFYPQKYQQKQLI